MNAMRVGDAAAPPKPRPADGFTALDGCHRKTLAMLGELSALVADLDYQGLTPLACESAAKIAAFFSSEAREHHVDEERHLFPALVATGKPELVEAVLHLQRDHDWLEEDWFDLAPQILAVSRGDRSYDIDVLRDGVPVLAALYRAHIELEESLIYPEARSRMGVDQRCEMGREMAARRRSARAAARQRNAG